jgi:carboxymethylenebutenolidase
MILRDHTYEELATSRGPMRTHVIAPAGDGNFPGIILFSEIFQVTAPIRRTAAFLAGHGYVVAVPEIFHDLEEPGCVLAYDGPGADRGNRDKITKELASYDEDAAACVQFLKQHSACNGKIGALGICIGGHLSFRCAFLPDVLASACFYPTDIHQGSLGAGKCDDTLKRMSEIKAEMLMVFGRQDPHVPREGRRIIYDAMTDAGLHFTWHEFNGQHAFLRDEGHRHDPELARQGYGLALDLFHRKLR